jgi:pimeloyl-ACP methyl ester carboxylesterase
VTTSPHETRSPHVFNRLTRRAALLGGAASLAARQGQRGAAQVSTPAASPTTASGEFAGLVDIGGGRQMYLECRGAGGPTVILEAGYGNNGHIWDALVLDPSSGSTAVLPGVASFTRVCAYDRPGTTAGPEYLSRSDPVPQPRTAADAVADLHALLTAARVPSPYVLVGHSFGGLIVRLYAATYPAEVAGLVLVDSSHEDYNSRLRAVLTADQWALVDHLSREVPPEFADYPELERMDFDASFDQLRVAAAQPLPTLPLVVLTHGVPFGADLPPELRSQLPLDVIELVAQELQAELAALVLGARQVIATESGHYIQVEEPALVIEAIHQVVAAVRDPSSWATPAASPAPAS